MICNSNVKTYVNETDELVHIFVNGEEIICTPTHPFYNPVKGWTDAVHLRAGDILVLVNGEYVVAEKVQHELLENPVEVYNFQVEDYHTYYVSESGVLVHNECEKIGKQYGNTPRNNQAQNKQFDAVAKKLHLDKHQRRELHDAIGKQGLGYQELLTFAKQFFNLE